MGSMMGQAGSAAHPAPAVDLRHRHSISSKALRSSTIHSRSSSHSHSTILSSRNTLTPRRLHLLRQRINTTRIPTNRITSISTSTLTQLRPLQMFQT
mmetsp:Transcript_29038/g.72619  ORF Transcript_29038/g.72619 Transcript_29038/m.72619 type:complete len:97 (-) Transcript_29038:347-637(-)